MHIPKYIIFDCDGVLIDSEILANRVEGVYREELKAIRGTNGRIP